MLSHSIRTNNRFVLPAAKYMHPPSCLNCTFFYKLFAVSYRVPPIAVKPTAAKPIAVSYRGPPPVLKLGSFTPLGQPPYCSFCTLHVSHGECSVQIVGWGAVPLLVSLLQQPSVPPSSLTLESTLAEIEAHASDVSALEASITDPPSSPKAQTYVLATLLLLAMHEPRHAAVIVRLVLFVSGICIERLLIVYAGVA